MAYTPGSMKPTWGYNAAGEWVMLNQLEFTAWRDAEEAKREEREREAKKHQRGWLWVQDAKDRATRP